MRGRLAHGGHAAFRLPGVAALAGTRTTISERAADSGRQVNCRLADTSWTFRSPVTAHWRSMNRPPVPGLSKVNVESTSDTSAKRAPNDVVAFSASKEPTGLRTFVLPAATGAIWPSRSQAGRAPCRPSLPVRAAKSPAPSGSWSLRRSARRPGRRTALSSIPESACGHVRVLRRLTGWQRPAVAFSRRRECSRAGLARSAFSKSGPPRPGPLHTRCWGGSAINGAAGASLEASSRTGGGAWRRSAG